MTDTNIKKLSMPSREDERAAALRANLAKRKAQARDKKTQEDQDAKNTRSSK